MFKQINEIGEIGFGEALIYIESEPDKLVKRKCIKNDTVIVKYKGRLYQRSTDTGVRYPYKPTDADIFAKDWIVGELVC